MDATTESNLWSAGTERRQGEGGRRGFPRLVAATGIRLRAPGASSTTQARPSWGLAPQAKAITERNKAKASEYHCQDVASTVIAAGAPNVLKCAKEATPTRSFR